jgi:hypothetical protein
MGPQNARSVERPNEVADQIENRPCRWTTLGIQPKRQALPNELRLMLPAPARQCAQSKARYWISIAARKQLSLVGVNCMT